MSNRKMIRVLSYILVIAFFLQSNISVANAFRDKEGIALEDNVKNKEIPKLKDLVTKKPLKIPSGLTKNQDKFEKWKDKKEIVENRTSNSKTFENGNGTFTALQYFGPIHIKDSEGKFVDIDNSLVSEKNEKGNNNYKNKLGLYNVLFSNTNKSPTIEVGQDNISISLTPKEATTQDISVEENKVMYAGNERGIDYLYTVLDNSVKEDIILNHYVDTDTFTYDFKVKGSAEVIEQDGEISVVEKKTGKPYFTLSAPFMVDADGNQSKELSLSVDRKGLGSSYTMTLKVDKAWLKDPARIYPVTIDPNINVLIYQEQKTGNDGKYLTGFQDTYVNQGDSDKNYHSSGVIKVGGFNEKINRAYIKVQIPSFITPETNIMSANLNAGKIGTDNPGTRIQAFKVINEDYNNSTITWSNQPDNDSAHINRMALSDDRSTSIEQEYNCYHWYITEAVKDWVAKGENYGIELVKLDGENSDGVEFYSSEASDGEPFIAIIYNNDKPVDPEKPELVLKRDENNIYSNGTAKATGKLLWEAGTTDETGELESDFNRATIKYKLMPDGTPGELVSKNFETFEWETPKFNLDTDKTYWIEADILVERVVLDPPEPGSGADAKPTMRYVEALTKHIETDKFVVAEVQPGDTLKKLAKYYMDDGSKYTELKKLNGLKELDSDVLKVSQKLFAISEKAEPYNYNQPDTVNAAMELEDINSGSEPLNTEMVGQYINPHTGAFSYAQRDFGFQTYNMDIEFIRSYNSNLKNKKSPLGDKWDYNYNKYLFFYKDGTIGYNLGDGSRIYFKKDATGKYITSAPTYDKLTVKGSGYVIKTRENIRYNFSDIGLLTSILDQNNNPIAVTYNENDWQKEIKDAVNRKISIEYYDTAKKSGNIKQVNFPGSASLKFDYDSETNNLTSFTDPEANSTTYGYGTDKKLETVTLPKSNTIIRNEYGEGGKVQYQYDGENNKTSLVYSGLLTTVKDGQEYTYKYSHNSKLWLDKKEYPDNKYESYVYHNTGDIKDAFDRMGQKSSYTYNELGYVTSNTRNNQKVTTYRYKNGYLLEYIKDVMDNVTDLTYDANNNLNMVKEYVTENGILKTLDTDYTFAANGLLEKILDPEKVETIYDNSGYPNKQVIKDNATNRQTFYFDDMGRTVASFDSKNNPTRYTLDKNGNIKEILNPGTAEIKRSTSYTYDKNGNLESETGSRLIPGQNKYATTLYHYDGNDRLTLVEDPYAYPLSYGYDANGNLSWEKDQEQNTTNYIYNSLNWLTEIYYPGQVPRLTKPGMTYTYDDLGNVKRQEEIDGGWTSYNYNYNVNKVESIIRPEGLNTAYIYDDMGNLKLESLPDKTTIAYEYDELSRVKNITEPSNITNIAYNNSSNIKEIKESAGKTYTYNYYPNGQLKNTAESFIDEKTVKPIAVNMYAPSNVAAGNKSIASKYDYLFNLVASTADLANLGLRSTAASEPISTVTASDTLDTGLVTYTTEYTYDENGNIQTVKDEQGRTTTYKYNEINQVAEVIDPKGNTQKYKYNEDGNVSEETDGSNNITKTLYDALNRTYMVSIPAENTDYVYLYNSRGLQESIIDPMGNPTTYRYDPMGRVKEVINAKNETVTYSYYPDGNLEKTSYPNGQSEHYNYDTLNRQKQYTDRSGVVHTTDYNSIGKVGAENDNVGNKTEYRYDSLARVDQIKDVAGRTKTYTYNSMGKIETEKDVDGNLTTYHYDPRGRVREIIDPENKTTKIAYNSDNNQTEVIKPGDRHYTYQYDLAGNLYKETDPLNNTTEYLYNGNNLVEEIIDARGYSEKYTYNGLNLVKTKTDQRDNLESYDYYPGGSLKTVTDAKKFSTKYTYDSLNQVETITDALQNITRYNYDFMGNVKSVGDPRGVSTTYTYNARDQVENTYDTQNGSTSKIYYPNGDLWKVSDQEGNTAEYNYDALHRMTKVKEANGYEKTYIYNSATGNMDKMLDNASKTIDYTYDKMHRLLQEITEQGLKTSYTYSDFGQLKTKTTPDGNTVTYSYDALDRITGILDPQNNLTKMAYDPMGNIDYIIKPGELKYDYNYDPAGNLEKTIDPLGQETSYTYDPNNNIATMLDPAGNQYTYSYDALNRLQSIIDLTNNGSGYHYDPSGNLDSMTDGNGNTTSYGYNNLNLLEWVKDGEGNTTRYTYYKDGNLKTMTDPRENTTTYSYDPAGKLAKMISPLGQEKSFEYTLLGQTDKVTKADGNQIDYVYDQYNRLEKINYPDETNVRYEYDDLNRKVLMEDKNGTTKYGYDKMGNLTQLENPTGEIVKYEYDEKGRKTKVIYPDNKYVTYSYDNYDRLETITDREGRTTTYTYDKAGRKKTIKLPNGITTSYEYDKANRITGIDSTKEDGSSVQKYDYTYDKAGNKVVEEIWKEGKHYKRDYTYYKNNTVKEMTESGDNSAYYFYHYDGAGNVDQKTVKKGDTTKDYTYTYDENNRMITQTEGGETRTYRYDANGNRTARVIGGGDTEDSSQLAPSTEGTTTEAQGISELSAGRKETADYFYYDYNDQLEQVVEHSGKNYTYGYDGEGNRLWRTYSQYSVIKPPVEEGETTPKEEPGRKTNNGNDGNSKDNDNNKDKEKNGNKGKNSSSIDEDPMYPLFASIGDLDLSGYDFTLSKNEEKENNGNGNSTDNSSGSSNGNGNSGSNGNSTDNSNSNSKDNSGNNGKDNSSNGNGNSGNNGNDKSNGSDKDKDNGNDKENGNNKDKEDKDNNGKAIGKDKEKSNNGKHLGWYKNKKNPHYGEGENEDGGYDLTNPEIFQVTNYINDLSEPISQVLMTTDVDGNYRGVYTYDNKSEERISEEDLGHIEGVPNDPLYYLKDALGTITAIANMNASIIDSNRFAPYGEALDPVAKNARLTNSPFGYTGESHDIEGKLVYLRARYYEPDTMRFLQQDTELGKIKEPLTRNLYAYAGGNPLMYTDPTGHRVLKKGMKGKDVYALQWDLKHKGYSLKTDSNFGSETDRILKQYQTKVGLKPDGLAGDKTKKSLLGIPQNRNDGYVDLLLSVHYPEPMPIIPSTSINSKYKGAKDPGANKGTGKRGGATITSGTLDPITQAAIKEAQGLLDGILDEYHPYEWPEGYSIGEYTWSAEYKTRYQNAVDRAKDVASFFNTLDLADDIKKTYEELSGTGVSNPYTLAVSSVLIGAWRNQADKEPGIAELPDALGISGWLTKNIAKAKEKSDFIDGSNYRYLVYSGQFLWEKGPRGMFIDNISNLEGTITRRTETRYNNAQDNAKYKQAVLNYLGVIKNMNANYNQSVSGMNSFLNEIDKKY